MKKFTVSICIASSLFANIIDYAGIGGNYVGGVTEIDSEQHWYTGNMRNIKIGKFLEENDRIELIYETGNQVYSDNTTTIAGLNIDYKILFDAIGRKKKTYPFVSLSGGIYKADTKDTLGKDLSGRAFSIHTGFIYSLKRKWEFEFNYGGKIINWDSYTDDDGVTHTVKSTQREMLISIARKF